MGICCMTQETQTGALHQPKGLEMELEVAGDEAENWNLDVFSLTWRIKLENGCGRGWV